ncbi:tryptophan 2,3-dioxygenase [Oscillatoria sp. FACHB-1407]|uniref:tryptophan 2,3-dioxygenase family protein n=1 Tax=Oscillatoria sp. FACHB-1407 TaxID=2692847 RepID=UPI001685D84E|nr:tryptophan 2,3-dioxygenase family protein [Oscillatoria sp. FACHB-1407]MBD2461456.1 tryptophan 2,3-dioxygenase [Oscillatoria sp. FACHB-1407]
MHPLPPLNPDLDVTQNHYWSYHGLETLLSCKQPLTASQDEDLFITVHQICELGFHQMIIDLGRVLDAIATALQDASDPIIGDTHEACYFLTRVLKLYEVAVTTMPILTTMRAFAEFRTTIGPTSGFQSFQFRHLEIMSGVPKYWEGGTRNAEGKLHVAETEFEKRYGAQVAEWRDRHQHHSLTHYYNLLLQRVDASSLEEKVSTLLEHPQAHPLLKQMQMYDLLQTRFHRAHLGLAAQQLKLVGADVGTGGTSFRQYLAKYEAELAPLFPGLSQTPEI